MIRRALGARMKYAGGFITYRAYDSEGALIGFDMAPAAYADSVKGFTAERFIDCSVSPFRLDSNVFRYYGVKLLREAENYGFSVCDEFGGADLLVPEFYSALTELLSSDTPLIGVFKGGTNTASLRDALRLDPTLEEHRNALTAFFTRRNDILVLETTGRCDTPAIRAVNGWVNEYAIK